MKTMYNLPKGLALFLLILIAGNPVFPAVRMVPAQYASIQLAINASQTNDTVIAEPGIYAENINFNGKSIVVGSRYILDMDPSYIRNTILDGKYNGISAVTFNHSEDGNSCLKGFLVRNGNTQYTGFPNEMGGGIKILNSSPCIENCIISNNYATYGGGIYMEGSSCSALIRNCTFEYNASAAGGGIFIQDVSPTALVLNCTFRNNIASDNGNQLKGGGGAYIQYGGKLENCLIVENKAISCPGGGILCHDGMIHGQQSIHIVGNTIVANDASAGGGVSFLVTGGQLVNSIIYGNTNGNYIGNTFIHCCSEPLPPGTGNIAANPKFINVGTGNYRLNYGSLCIQAGNNTYCNSIADLDGNPRILGTIIDMGCYESPENLIDHFEVEYRNPAPNATAAVPDGQLIVRFNQPVDTSTISNVKVLTSEAGLHPFVYLSDARQQTISLQTTSPFRSGELVEIIVPTSVVAVSGTPLSQPLVWRFHTKVLENFYVNMNLEQSVSSNATSGWGTCDLNSDNFPDFYLTTASGYPVMLFGNMGDGTFGSFDTLSANGIQDGAGVAVHLDLENDSDIDLLTPTANMLFLWKNNGSNGFTLHETISAEDTIIRLIVADFNGDGFQDVACYCMNASVSVYLNNAGMGFNAPQLIGLTGMGILDAGINCGDLDNDGDIDLLAARNGLLRILRNTMGVFSVEDWNSIPASGILTADFNGDGFNDLILDAPSGNGYATRCFLYDPVNAGFIQHSQIITSPLAGSMKTAADSDADGDLDLTIVDSGNQKVLFFLNTGAAFFTPAYEIPGDWLSLRSLAITDLDKDGDLDMLVADSAFMKVFHSGLPAVNWTGALNTDWFQPGNWSNLLVPTATNTVVVSPVTAIHQPSIEGAVALAGKVIIQQGASLTIQPTGSLDVNFEVINHGEIHILSDADGNCGSLLDNGLSGSGYFSLHRNVKSIDYTISDCEDYIHNNNPGGWHYLSSPVSGLSTFSIPVGDYWINDWEEAGNTWFNFSPGSNIPCVPGADNDWIPMKGYSLKYCPAYNCPQYGTGETIEFSGNMQQVNTGEKSIGYTASDNTINDFANWNLLGNPYPSAVDPSTIDFPMSMDASVYFWDDVNLTYEVWAGGIGPIIPPAQGFFIHALRNGTLTLGNHNRSVNGSNAFFKSGIKDMITLEASSAKYTDRTRIRFLEEATDKFDRLWDAYKILTQIPGVPQIYTRSGQVNQAINACQPAEQMPLYFQAGSSGSYTISLTENSGFSQVVLEDLVDGIQTNLLSGGYTFWHEAGASPGRFVLHFSAVAVPGYSTSRCTVNQIGHQLCIECPNAGNFSFRLVDITGRLWLSGESQNPGCCMDAPRAGGIYVLELNQGASKTTHKVLINTH